MRTIHIDGKMQRGLLTGIFVRDVEIGRLQRENEKLSIDSVALDKIIKIMDAWRMYYAPDRAHITLDEITKTIEERGD